MRKNFQLNQLKRLVVTGLVFLAYTLSAQVIYALPADDLDDFWTNLYVTENVNLVQVTNEPFQWVVPDNQYCSRIGKVIETAAEAKECQVCTYLAGTNIVPGTWTVSSEPSGEGIVFYNSYEYDISSSSGRICIDRDDYTTDERILHDYIMGVGPTYYISYKYDPVTTLSSQVLDNPGPGGEGYLLAKAEQDQCFNASSSSEPNTIADMGGVDNGVCEPVDNDDEGDEPNQTYPKRNQGYVWSMFMDNDNDKLWFGTVPNTLCLVAASSHGTTPILSQSLVCEFGQSPYGIANGLESAAGDWRPPHIYVYDTAGGDPVEKTPVSAPPEDPLYDQNDLINDTMGIRSSGAANGVAIVGGPSLAAIGGGSLSAGLEGEVNLFAYNSVTGDFIESYQYTGYNDVRKWVLINGVLYTSMKSTDDGSGHILRWRGTLADPLGPDAFEIVGVIPNGMGAYLAEHEGRIFVTTWPALEIEDGGGVPSEDDLASLFMSPVIPEGGLSSTHQNGWTKVWDVGEYEIDYLTSFTYGGGALASFNGYLYWGTIHVLNIANQVALGLHCSEGPGCPSCGGLLDPSIDLDTNGDCELDSVEEDAVELGTFRPLTLFRGRNFVSQENKDIELLSGLGYMPFYYKTQGEFIFGSKTPPAYSIAQNPEHRNKMDQDPLWGPAGMGYMANVYTWSMEVYNNRLYIGTFDSSYVGGKAGKDIAGADLYRVDCDNSPAKRENLTGIGNQVNYGVRNMVTDGDYLYLGMANPMNLHPDGGWELLRLGDNAKAGEDVCGNICSPQEGIVLSFDQVVTAGGCEATIAAGSEPPDNFNFLGQTYEITASGGFTGPVDICFDYDESAISVPESKLTVMHRQDAGSPWEDITTTRNAEDNIVCGRAASLSEFVVGEDLTPAPAAAGGGGGGGCFISSAVNSFLGL